MWNVVLGGLHSFTYICFFRFQIVFLFDTLDTATGCISTVFQCTSTLFHANDFGPRQTTQFQCAIQVSHRNRHQFIVANVRDGARWQWSLQIIKQHPSNKHTDYSIDYTQIYTSFCTLNCDLLCSCFFRLLRICFCSTINFTREHRTFDTFTPFSMKFPQFYQLTIEFLRSRFWSWGILNASLSTISQRKY